MADPVAAVQVANPDLTAAVVQISSFLSHVTVSGVSAQALEYVKNTPLGAQIWVLLSKRTRTAIGALMAMVGSLGITATFQHDPHAQAGVYTVLLTGLTGPSLLQHAWSFVQSWLFQQGWYQKYLKPTSVTGPAAAPYVPGAPPPAPPAPVPVHPV
jgi:hypothetical protein